SERTVGKPVVQRTVFRIESNDRHVSELYFTPPGGKEQLALRIVYTRIKKRGSSRIGSVADSVKVREVFNADSASETSRPGSRRDEPVLCHRQASSETRQSRCIRTAHACRSRKHASRTRSASVSHPPGSLRSRPLRDLRGVERR